MAFVEWRPVPDFAVRYEITEDGRVRDKFSMEELRVGRADNTVWLYKGGKRHQRSVHKLVRLAYSDRQTPVFAEEGYRPVYDVPGYSMNRKGNVFNERLRRLVTVGSDGTVQLQIRGQRVHRTVRSLIRDTFGE